LLKPTPYLVANTLLWLLAAPWLLFPTLAPAVTALALLLLLLARLSQRRINGQFFQTTPFDGLIAFFLAMTAVAFVISPLPAVSLPKLTVISLGVFGYYLVQDWATSEPTCLRPFTALLALVGGGIALIAPFVLEWPSRQIYNLQAITGRLPHLSGSFYINYNEMAGTLILLLPLTLAWKPVGRLGRFVGLALVLLMAAVLILTQSRGAFLALATAGGLALLWGRFPVRWLMAALLAPLLLLPLLLAFTSLESSDLSASLATLDANSKSGQVEAVSWLARLEIWRNALEMAADYPVLGAGLYTFAPLSRLNYPYQLIQPNFELAHAHNLMLETAATTGWPAALALAVLWLAAGYGLWQAVRRLPPAERGLARLYSASLICYLAFNLFDALTFGQKPGVIVWFILAGAAGLLRQGQVRLSPYLVVPSLLLLGLLCLTPALPRNLANQQLDDGRLGGGFDRPATLYDRLQGDARRLGVLAYHLDDRPAALAYWQADPQAVPFLSSQGHQWLEVGRYEEAVAWCTLALALEPTAVWPAFWRGQAYEAMGQTRLALADYEMAAGNSAAAGLSRPWQAHLHYIWGRLLFLEGETAAAHAAWQQAAALNPTIPWRYLIYLETH
jgi:O-antigen ligase